MPPTQASYGYNSHFDMAMPDTRWPSVPAFRSKLAEPAVDAHEVRWPRDPGLRGSDRPEENEAAVVSREVVRPEGDPSGEIGRRGEEHALIACLERPSAIDGDGNQLTRCIAKEQLAPVVRPERLGSS